MADQTQIIEIQLEGIQGEIAKLGEFQKQINRLAQEKKKLTAQEKALTDAVKKGTKTEAEQQDALRDVAEQQVKNNLALKETKKQFQETERAVINHNKSVKVNTGSLAQMRLELAKDQKAYVNLSKAERENEEVGGVLQKRIKAQSDELKDLEKDIGITSRSVGDYGSAMQDTLPLMGGFGQQIQTVIGTLGGIKTAVGKFATAQRGLIKSTKASNGSLKAFRIALISTGIGAIVVLLGSLLAAFGSTQRGADAFTKILRPLEEIMKSLLGVIQRLATDGVDRLKAAFEDPKQAVIDLGEAIKQNFLNRLEAIPILAKAITGAVVGSFKLIGLGIKNALKDVPLIGKFIDQDQLKKDLEETEKQTIEAFKSLGSGVIQIQTGIDREGQKELFDDINNFVTGAAARGTEIDKVTKSIEIAAITLNRERERGNRLFQEQKEIAQNTLLTDEERLAAAANAKQILADVTKLEADQLDRQIKLAKLKTEANDTDREAQKEIQDLIADKERVEAAAISKRIELGNQANGIVKARIAADKKAVEDNRKAEEKAAKDKIKEDSKAIDKKIADLELFRQLELATIDETNEQKIEKERELLDAIGKLRVEKAKLNGEDVAEVELQNTIAKAEQEQVIKEENDAKELEQEEVKKDNITQVREAAFAAGESFLQEAFTNQERRIKDGLTRETEALKLKRQAGEISEKEFEEKRLELEKQAFSKRKKLSQAQNIIDFAVAAGKTVANLGLPLALPALGVLAIQKAAQAAIISSQKFAQGGVIHGASHAQGGVNVSVGGAGMIEAEGGEAIINKRSTAKHIGLLSAINQDGGGVALAANGMVTPSASKLKFGNGGIATTVVNQGGQLDLNQLKQAIVESQNEIVVKNVASETTGVANRVQQIEDSASF